MRKRNSKDLIIKALKDRIRLLEREIECLRTHPALAQGLKGERLICKLTKGMATKLNADFDVFTKNGLKLEVKFSKLNTPMKSAPDTKRWTWSKPLGWQDKGKGYDFLLLVAEKDPRYKGQYLDQEPYAVFLIPVNKVPEIVVRGRIIGANVNLTTNFSTVRSKPGRCIIKHMLPLKEIKKLLKGAKTEV